MACMTLKLHVREIQRIVRTADVWHASHWTSVSGMHRTAPSSSGADRREIDLARDETISYPVPKAAGLIGLSERRVWDLIRLGELRSFLTGGRRLIRRRDLQEWADQKVAEAQADGADNERTAS